MHPHAGEAAQIICPAAMPAAAGLRDLVFMVREFQVSAAAVNVKRQAEMFFRHGRALNVPAGAAKAERAVPPNLTCGGGFPQHEISRVFLVRRYIHARAGNLVIAAAA